jgi:hypothetical protein
MKKIYLSFLSIFCAGVINAQLTQTNNAPAVGDNFMTVGVNSVGIVPGASGTGVTWNFSSVTTTTATNNYTVVTPASTGSASTYPSASAAVQWGTNNNFYSSTAASLSFWGGNMSLAGTSALMTFTSPAVYAKYPMSFGTTTTSVVGGTANILGQPGSFTGSVTSTIDGMGTLQLPTTTINNAMRVMISSMYTFTFTFTNGTANQLRYDWYNPASSKSALFSISNTTLTTPLGTTTETVVTINSMYVLGVKEQSAVSQEFSVYPNPAKEMITMEFTNNNGEQMSYEIVNALGQPVLRSNLGNQTGLSKASINISHLESGIYFVKLNNGSNHSVKKITIQ